VHLFNLIRNNDCAMPYLDNARTCLGPPKAPCPDCRTHMAIVAWDEHHQKLYFALSTLFSLERPFTIFNYSLA
jgi:hypothetical protein